MNRIVSRIQKMAAETVSIAAEVKKLSKDELNKIAKEIARKAEGFAENYVEDLYEPVDQEEIEEKFFEGLDDNDILECVQDYLENVTDEQLNSASKADLDELKDLLFEVSQIEVGKAIDDVLHDADFDAPDPDGDNAPYGPGMSMRDFI